MDINEARAAIDEADSEILKLFLRRMELCRAIAEEKGRDKLPVRDKSREQQILSGIAAKSGEMARYSTALFDAIMALSRSYQRELLSGGEKGWAIIGAELCDSFLLRIHDMLGISGYELPELSVTELEPVLRHSGYKGFEIAEPYKRAVIRFCDELDDEAGAIGAVNTIVRKADGRLVGCNTDALCLENAIKCAKIAIKGRKVLVLGSGGAALAAQHAARKNGAESVTAIALEGEPDYAELARLSDSEVIINCTTAGRYPDCGEAPLSLGLFPDCKGVVDMVYNPLRTRLMLEAQRLGIPCTGGLGTLVYQAKRAGELFGGCSIADDMADTVLDRLYKDCQNIVIIGMPGSGKSTVARELAAVSGKRLYCIDRELARETGMSAEAIIKTYGEQRFRAYEREQIAKAGAMHGLVIDCGGGAVTVPENYASMHQNGKVYCLERELDKLETSGRPLSSNMDALIKLVAVRGPMYDAFADKKQENNSGTAKETAQRIWEDYCENTRY